VLTIIVPVYNEAERIRPALDRLVKTELPLQTEILVVDDGSSDGSSELISDLVTSGAVNLIRHERNRGKGAAVRTGIENASGDLLTICDADLEYDPDDYAKLLQPILDGDSQIVYGTRTFGAHTAFSFWYVLGNRVVNLWASFLFNTWLSDVETCFKMAPVEVWRSLGIRSNGFGLEAEATGKILRAGHVIYEVPISYRARTRMQGKKLQWTDGVAALWILLRQRVKRPPRRT